MRTVASHTNHPPRVPVPPPTSAHDDAVVLAQCGALQRGIPIPIVVDFVHVMEYLWKAVWCFYPEADPAAETWVAEHALRILNGQASTVAAAIRRKATTRGLDPPGRRNADTAATYLINKKAYLDYPTALESGWPIATGIIEGACRHLVKDRMDITGARWGLPVCALPAWPGRVRRWRRFETSSLSGMT